VRGMRAEPAEMWRGHVVYGLRRHIQMRADSQPEQRLPVVYRHERNHAVEGMMVIPLVCNTCGRNLGQYPEVMWIPLCPDCDKRRAEYHANARLGAAVREAYRRALDKVRGQPHQPQTIAEYVRNWAEFHDSGIGRAIADALEAEAGDVAG